LKTAIRGSWKRGLPYNSALLRHPPVIRFPHSSRRLDGNSSAVGFVCSVTLELLQFSVCLHRSVFRAQGRLL
jgi:hypothetical protein